MKKILNNKKHNQKGFTLMELLVVILIIGILVGMGISQYTKLVDKTKESSHLPMVKALHDSLQRYSVKKGSWDGATFNNLDVEIECEVLTVSNTKCHLPGNIPGTNKNEHLQFYDSRKQVYYNYSTTGTNYYIAIYSNDSTETTSTGESLSGKRICIALDADSSATGKDYNILCASLGTLIGTDSDGHKMYQMN